MNQKSKLVSIESPADLKFRPIVNTMLPNPQTSVTNIPLEIDFRLITYAII
jgi:hypothetical protein